MFHRSFHPAIWIVALSALLLGSTARDASGQAAENRFANPGFEMGQDGWYLAKAEGTKADFRVDDAEAAEGRHSVKIAIGQVKEWGAQFGQGIKAGEKGKTYTFAVLAKSTGGPVRADLQIERRAKPHERAARTDPYTLAKDKWTEMHVTFTVEKDFPQGWFAYINCAQPNCEFRADMFRLYEGAYVPYEKQAQEDAAAEGVRLFDTNKSSPSPLSGGEIAKREGWTAIPEDTTAHEFKGDVVFANRKIAVVLRKKGTGAELYSSGRSGWTRRALLAPPSDPPTVLSTISISENNPGEVAVKALDNKGTGLRVSLKIGQMFVETAPLGQTQGLRMEAPCRFAVLPDFFADDIVLDAQELPVSQVEVPGDNFLLHLLGGGEAIAMAVSNTREKDFRALLAGEKEGRQILASDIHYGKDGKVWVALLDEPAIWHMRNIAKEDKNKVIQLDWAMPFPAQWRVDWRRDNDLTDSWEMIAELPDGKFLKHGWFGGASTIPADRKKWTSVLGRFEYPCWVDKSGRGRLQPLKEALTFVGPAVLYPINRVKETPLDRLTVVDIIRETLGVGPCEYILDVQSQQLTYKGRATCGVRDTLNPIYEKKQQKQKKAEIEKALQDVVIFVTYIRGRIEEYVTWGHDMLKYLDGQKKTHPELAEVIAEMEGLTRDIDAKYAEKKDKIKTPAYVADLCNKFRAEVMDYEGADALERCKKITAAFVEVGGNQDHLVGDCRVAAKRLRQRAGLAMAKDPRVSEIAKEIRKRTTEIMRNPASYEAPRY
ncbi:MAG: carbohydrate binding domain-containing protein [Planctomycetota bacterium]